MTWEEYWREGGFGSSDEKIAYLQLTAETSDEGNLSVKTEDIALSLLDLTDVVLGSNR